MMAGPDNIRGLFQLNSMILSRTGGGVRNMRLALLLSLSKSNYDYSENNQNESLKTQLSFCR